MALETALIDIPLTGGVDERKRSELVNPPSFTALTNLRQLKTGAYQKRRGNVAVSNTLVTSGSAPACKRLIGPFRDEEVRSDGLALYSRTATGLRKVSGMSPQCQTTRRPVVPTGFLADSFDVASVNGYFIFGTMTESLFGAPGAYVNILQMVLVDQATGAVVHTANIGGDLSALTQWCMVVCGNVVMVIKGLGGSANISGSKLDTTSAATITTGWSAPANIITDADGGAAFDMVGLTSTLMAVAYVNAAGGLSKATVTTFNTAFTLQTTTTFAPTANVLVAPSVIGIGGISSDTLWIVWPHTNTTDVRVIGLNPSTLAVTATAFGVVAQLVAVPTMVSVTRTGAQAGMVLCHRYGDGTTPLNSTVCTRTFQISGGAVNPTGSQINTRGVRVETRPFAVNGRLYCNMRPSTASQSSGNNQQLVTVDLTQTYADSVVGYAFWRVVANPAPRLTLGNFSANPLVNHAAVLSTTKAVFAAQVATKYGVSGSIELVTLDFAAPNLLQSGTIGQACVVGGGTVSTYDGVRSEEAGFLTTPSITSISAGAGAGLDDGLFNYVGVYEKWDASGQVHQSAPSDPKPVTCGGGSNQVTANVFCSALTNRADVSSAPESTLSPLHYVLYRTKVGGLPPYYRVKGSVSCVDPSFTTFQSYLDTTADNALGPQLYTQPGLANTAQYKTNPPGSTCLISHQDRIVLVADDQKSVWYSGQQVYGEGVWFSDLFQMTVGNAAPITALASIDGALVVFKRSQVYFIDGQGPADNGGGGDFSPPQQIASDVGCIEPRSVVLTPDGVIFQSLRGLELLTRARQIAPFFGNSVETSLDANPVITSAVLNEAEGTVTFTCLPYEGSSTGITLVWDYVSGVWNPGTLGNGSIANVGVQSAMMVGTNVGTVPVMTWMQTVSGSVFQESQVEYTDNGAWVTTTLETAWIKTGGVAGLQMAVGAVLQAESLSTHDLTISVAYDFYPIYVESKTWTAVDMAAFTTLRETLQIDLQNPECTAFRLKITDATPSAGGVGTGQGCAYLGLEIECGANGKFILLPEANRK